MSQGESGLLAFGLSILLFTFWIVIGYAVVTALHKQSSPLQSILLSPVVGLAVTILPVFWLNRLGIPVMSFGKLLALVLLLAGIALIWKFRPKIPWRDYLPFTGIFLLALVLTGRPMLEFGFDWVSYANDDMANYCLGADRFLNHGFFDLPNSDNLLKGKDYSLFYWFMHAPGGVRPGSELILAWVCSLTGLTAHQIFMPTILAFHLTLISTAGALIYQSRAFYSATILTCLLLSLSALNSLGTLYQLIAQVSGLSLLIGCVALLPCLLKKAEIEIAENQLILQCLLFSMILAGTLVFYPEVSPFLFLTALCCFLVYLIQGQLAWKKCLIVLGLVALLQIIFLRFYLFNSVSFLFDQTSGGFNNTAQERSFFVFPYYLVPSGLANLWGMQSIIAPSGEPWLSISILLGTFLLIVVVAASILLVRLAHPATLMTSVMLILGALLFVRQSDFGLFKLSMFIQPFMMGSLVVWWLGTVKQPVLRISPLLLIGLMNLPTQQLSYTEASRGMSAGGLVEVSNGSALRINTTFQKLVSGFSTNNLIIDTSNIVLAKFQALYTKPIPTAFLSRDFFSQIASLGYTKYPGHSRMISAHSLALLKDLDKFTLKEKFDMHEQSGLLKNDFVNPSPVWVNSTPGKQTGHLVTAGGKQDIFNRKYSVVSSRSNLFETKPLEQVRNHIIFKHSQLGQHYYLGENSRISLYQLERDWFFPQETMAGVGRYFLLQALNPTPNVRLVLSMTTSLKGDRENKLPPAEAIGNERKSFGLIGRGSARVFSAPLSPQVISGDSYLGIDMRVDGNFFSKSRTGLMNLYGKDVMLDGRKLVGFGREISLISEEEYANLDAPEQLNTFPSDLANPDLEYSGIYEDGWVSEAAFVNLKQPPSSSKLTVKGVVPQLEGKTFTSELAILVDGKEVSRQTLQPGEFDIQLDTPQERTRRRVDLRFSNFQHLPNSDNRPVAAKLKSVGFTK